MELKNLRSMKKTMAPLLISVSIFSLVLSWSSLSSLTLAYYRNLHNFYTNSFHLISIVMSKNCIFLIFNGILVFLAKTSALLCPPSDSDLDISVRKRIFVDQVQVETTEAETLAADKLTLDDESFHSIENYVEEDEEMENDPQEEEEEEEVEEMEVADEESEKSNEVALQQLISIVESNHEDDEDEDEDEEEEEDEKKSNGGKEEGEEVDEDDEIEKLSNDELNQRFEDFIRKRKEEFKINQYQHQQQQQLVLVK